MGTLPHSCFRCGRPLADLGRRYCSSRCRQLTLATFGNLDEPRQWLVYDYSTFDPEEELYGEYAANPEMASREGYIRHAWTQEEEYEAGEERRDILVDRRSDQPLEMELTQDTVQVADDPNAFAELAALLATNPSMAVLPPELSERIGRQLRDHGLEGILSYQEVLGHRLRQLSSWIPLADRRHIMYALKLTADAERDTWFGVRLLLKDQELQDEAFAYWWSTNLTADVRAQLALWAFSSGVRRICTADAAEHALEALTSVRPLHIASPKLADDVLEFMIAVAPQVEAFGNWIPCLLKWACANTSHLSDPTSKLWVALNSWWSTNKSKIRPEHLAPLTSSSIVPVQIRIWATSMQLQALDSHLNYLRHTLQDTAVAGNAVEAVPPADLIGTRDSDDR